MNARRMSAAQLRSLASRLDAMSYIVDDDSETLVQFTMLPVLDRVKQRLGYLLRNPDGTWSFEVNRPMEPTPIPEMFGVPENYKGPELGLVSAFGEVSSEEHDFLGAPAEFDEPPTVHPVVAEFH